MHQYAVYVCLGVGRTTQIIPGFDWTIWRLLSWSEWVYWWNEVIGTNVIKNLLFIFLHPQLFNFLLEWWLFSLILINFRSLFPWFYLFFMIHCPIFNFPVLFWTQCHQFLDKFNTMANFNSCKVSLSSKFSPEFIETLIFESCFLNTCKFDVPFIEKMLICKLCILSIESTKFSASFRKSREWINNIIMTKLVIMLVKHLIQILHHRINSIFFISCDFSRLRDRIVVIFSYPSKFRRFDSLNNHLLLLDNLLLIKSLVVFCGFFLNTIPQDFLVLLLPGVEFVNLLNFDLGILDLSPPLFFLPLLLHLDLFSPLVLLALFFQNLIV